MPLDDRLRNGLGRIAEEVNPDVEEGFRRATSARPPSSIRRVSRVLAFAAAVALGIAVIGFGGRGLLDRLGTSPSAAPSSNQCPNPDQGACAGLLEPGPHRSTQFIPPLDYRVPSELPTVWDNPDDSPGNFTLHPDGPATDAIFFFRDVRVLTEGCNPHLDQGVGGTSAEIVTWMTANPGLVTTIPRVITVGGLRGVQLDLAASGSYTTVCPDQPNGYPAGLPVLPLLVGAGSGNVAWYIGGDEQMRLYLLDLPGGGNLVISVDAIGGDFETLVEVSQPLINSITFDEDYY